MCQGTPNLTAKFYGGFSPNGQVSNQLWEVVQKHSVPKSKHLYTHQHCIARVFDLQWCMQASFDFITPIPPSPPPPAIPSSSACSHKPPPPRILLYIIAVFVAVIIGATFLFNRRDPESNHWALIGAGVALMDKFLEVQLLNRMLTDNF